MYAECVNRCQKLCTLMCAKAVPYMHCTSMLARERKNGLLDHRSGYPIRNLDLQEYLIDPD